MLSRVDRTRLLAGAIAMLVVGCTSTNDLLVFLETDLRPGSGSTDEFDSVEIEVTRGGIRVRDDLVDAGTLRFSAHRSTRIGVFRGLPSADYVVAVTLFAGPDTVIRYPAHVHVASDYTLTVRLSRSCTRTLDGRAAYERCVGETQACLDGRCVSEACLRNPTAEECGFELSCTADADCARSIICAIATCSGGSCLQFVNDSLCDPAQVCDVTLGCRTDPRDTTCVPGEPGCCVRALFEDQDGDGIGGAPTLRCPGPGLVETGGDCDDLSASVGICLDRDAGAARDAGLDAGACVDDASCDDHVFCNGAERCESGRCARGTTPLCDDTIACTIDRCDPTADGCAHLPDAAACTLGAGGRCDIATGCQYAECTPATCVDDPVRCIMRACMAGVCTPTSTCTASQSCCAGTCGPIDCTDGDPCTADSCDPGGCAHQEPRASATCDDGNACTTGDVCRATGGLVTCVGSPTPCDDMNPCTDDSCDPAIGCQTRDNAAGCTDGNDCTVGDACLGGTCRRGAARDCDDRIPCTVDGCLAGACTHAPGSCPAPSTCIAGVGCTGGCDAAACAGSAPPCHSATCVGPTCVQTPLCTAGQLCCSGVCATCTDDSNVCTSPLCSGTTCVNSPVPGACNDGLVCTSGDTCTSGVCAGTPLACSDGNPCTLDVCNTGACEHGSYGAGWPCDDGNTCTTGDVCNAVDVCSGTPCAASACTAVDAMGCCVSLSDGSSCPGGDPILCTVGRCVSGTCTNVSDCIFPRTCCEGLCCSSAQVCCTGLGCFHVPPAGCE